MLWPIVLPLKITFWVSVAIVFLMTAFAPAIKRNRGKTFLIVSAMSCFAFIPSCTAIMSIIDARRFRVFQHDTYTDVQDFRIERYLPNDARNITLDKFAMGHRAQYSISKSALTAYLDDLWNRYGDRSTTSRDKLNDGSNVTAGSYQHHFDDLGWPGFDAIKFHSPVERDGGGATYYFDPAAGKAYHRAGYW